MFCMLVYTVLMSNPIYSQSQFSCSGCYMASMEDWKNSKLSDEHYTWKNIGVDNIGDRYCIVKKSKP